MTYHILVAEDDSDIAQLLKLYLEKEGWEVSLAEDGVEAMQIAEKTKVDLAVLDLMMPRMDGWAVTQKLREKSKLPILILSARNQYSDKVIGLDLGADDYMTKPFNPLEIIARIKALLRRYYKLGAAETSPEVLEAGDLVLDQKRMTLTKRGENIPLTPTEFRILSMLMEKPGTVFTKMQVYTAINGTYFSSDDNTIMVHISNLRDKIEDDAKNPQYIHTVRGLGYRFEYEK